MVLSETIWLLTLITSVLIIHLQETLMSLHLQSLAQCFSRYNCSKLFNWWYFEALFDVEGVTNDTLIPKFVAASVFNAEWVGVVRE